MSGWLVPVCDGRGQAGPDGPPSTRGISPPARCSLSIGGDGGAFEQQAAGAVLDLMGDETQNLTRGRQQLRW